MGRKPNPLVSEFFERGPKLDDSSNRYEHTCKSCHEKIEKGRIDALTLHLLKRCAALSPQERQRVIFELSEKPNQNGSVNQLAVDLRDRYANGNLDSANAFDCAPGQELDFEAHPYANPRKRKRQAGRKVNPDQKRYETTFQLQSTSPPTLNQAQKNGAATEHTDENLLQDLKQYTQDSQDKPQARVPESGGVSETRLDTNQLELAATIASGMMESETGLVIDSPGNPPVTSTASEQEIGGAPAPIDPLLQEAQHPAQGVKSPAHSKHREIVFHHVRPRSNPSIAHAPYLHDFSIHSDGSKSKLRTKFSDDRRKEVQEVRKQGACIRCRMLKKPCSGEDPCSTCRSVELARLWKTPCMRARIADEFDVLRENIHLFVVINELGTVTQASLSDVTTGVIEVRHFPPELVPPAMFNSKKRQTFATMSKSETSPLPTIASADSFTHIEYLNFQHGDIGDSLAHYLQAADRLYCERESSHFMRETLLMALDLVDQTGDALLRTAIALWSSTQLLAGSQTSWQIRSHAENAVDSASISQQDSVEIPSESLSHRLITLQLHEFVEKRACGLCRLVMHGFERRLIQRQKVHQQQFETFLTAIILMNCLEKMSWLFNTWAVKEKERQDRNDDDSARSIATERGAWPSERSPQEFVEKGERVADIIAMLMKMRELPPPMAVDQEKYLVADLTKKAPKGAKYDASGYQPPKKTVNQTDGHRSAVDSGFNDTGVDTGSSRDRQEPPATEQGFQPTTLDEQQLSLIEQLHRDLQASALKPQVSPGAQNEEVFSEGLSPSVRAGRAPPSGISTQVVRHSSREELDAGDDINSDAKEAIEPEDTSQPNGQAQSEDTSPGQDRDQKAPPDEDPLMAHLRQAAAETAKGVERGDVNQDSDELENDARDIEDQSQQTPPVMIWFERVKLKVEDLIRAKQNAPWNDKDCHCWELKYISRMLLPDVGVT